MLNIMHCIHLVCFNDAGDPIPPLDLGRHDIRWLGQDYVAFKLVALRWWDDASYIAYQSDCGMDGEDEGEPETGSTEQVEEKPAFVDDGIPF